MKFTYTGPLDAVDVPALGLVGVKRGQQVDASGRAAQSLAEQPDSWQPAPAKSPAKN